MPPDAQTPAVMMMCANATILQAAAASLLFSSRIALMGTAWRKLFDPPTRHDEEKQAPLLVRLAQATAIGTAATVISGVLLGMGGMFLPVWDWTATLLLAAAGVAATSGGRLRSAWKTMISDCALLIAFLGTTGFFAMLMPKWSEWVVGGWDPGVYMNIGIQLARTGSLGPWPDDFLSSLSLDQRLLFCRVFPTWLEPFPGFSMDPASGAIRPMFFPGTPALIATLHRIGGIHAAVRLNAFTGIMAALAISGLAQALSDSRRTALISLVMLILQPIWTYHLHVPVSEMLQTLLVAGAGLAVCARRRHFASDIALATLLFAGMLNRLSFLPFGCLALAAASWLDAAENNFTVRMLVIRSCQALALVCGAILDLRAAPMTWERLSNAIPALIASSAAIFCGVIALAVLSRLPGLLNPARRFPRLPLVVAISVMFAIVVVPLVVQGEYLEKSAWNVVTILPYLGYVPILVSILGLISLTIETRHDALPLQTWLAFLVAATAATLGSSHIARLLPWATRRYLEFTVPLLCVSGAWFFERLWTADNAKFRLVLRSAACVLALAGLALQPLPTIRAARALDYPNACAALEEAAARIAPTDLVLAENPLWGTPLRFIHGLHVVSPFPLASRSSAASARQRLMDVLNDLSGTGRKVRILTSGREGLAALNIAQESATTDWRGHEHRTSAVAHGRRASTFRGVTRSIILALHTLLPDARLRDIPHKNIEDPAGEDAGQPR